MVFDQKRNACVMLQGYTSLAEKLGKEVEEEERRGLPEARAAMGCTRTLNKQLLKLLKISELVAREADMMLLLC